MTEREFFKNLIQSMHKSSEYSEYDNEEIISLLNYYNPTWGFLMKNYPMLNTTGIKLCKQDIRGGSGGRIIGNGLGMYLYSLTDFNHCITKYFDTRYESRTEWTYFNFDNVKSIFYDFEYVKLGFILEIGLDT